MSAAVGTSFSASKEIGLNKNEEENKKFSDEAEVKDKHGEDVVQNNKSEHDEEDDANKLNSDKALDLGPQFSLKEQLDKDKDDESLRRWKEKLIGSVDVSAAAGESKEPEVKILSLSIVSPGRADIVLPIPFTCKPKTTLFTLKEGNRFRLKFNFTVSNNIVSGLKYLNTVWRAGIRVDNRKLMLGTYSPRKEPYAYEFEEETTPSSMFARGSYSARTKFVDDDGKSYLDVSYYFEIQKHWGSHS